MKKTVIAIVLSVVLATGSIGIVPVLAAESNTQETVSVPENSAEGAGEVEIVPETGEAANLDDEAMDDNEIDTAEPAAEESAPEDEITDTVEPLEHDKVRFDETADTDEPSEQESMPEDEMSVVAETSGQGITEQVIEPGDEEAQAGIEEIIEEEIAISDENKAQLDGNVVDSGTCGGTKWTLTGKYSNLTLTISGSGEMERYDLSSCEPDHNYYDFYGPTPPWFGDRLKIRTIIIEDGVKSIGDYAFCYFSNLSSVTIPDSVRKIGHNAFDSSNPSKVYISSIASWMSIERSDAIPGVLYINGAPLTELIIPDGVTEVKDNAFRSCTQITSVKIPSGVTRIGKSAFSGCSALTSVTIPSSVTQIEDSAFYGCRSLTSVSIPSGVKSIGGRAFCKCGKLKSVMLSSSVKSIGEYAFSNCSLTSLVIPANITSCGRYAFSDNEITSVTLSDKTTVICDNLLSGCFSLESITIPKSVKSIGSKAFCDCIELKRINITSLDAWLNTEFLSVWNDTEYELYLNNEPLTKLAIPDGITQIGQYTFLNCVSLTSVEISGSVEVIGHSAFDGCNNIKNITISKGVKDIGNNAFVWCENLENITIPDSVTTIRDNAFTGCIGLKKIAIPDSVTSIGKKAFSKCSGLSTITIPDSVTTIEEGTFSDCSGLLMITIPNSVTVIGDSAFLGCSSLENIEIPGSVTGIEEKTFYNCSGLLTITIPDSVMYIGKYAFGKPDEYIEDMFSPGDVIDATLVYLGTEEQWNMVSKQEAPYKSLIINSFGADTSLKLPKKAYNYTGSPIKPPVTVTCNGRVLVQDKDYKLKYENNIDFGKATVSVTGIGNNSGTAKLDFLIRLGNTPKVTCTNVASGMKVSWEKVSGATRYYVFRGSEQLFTTSALAVTDKDVKYYGGHKYTYRVVAYAKTYGTSELSKTGTYYRLMPVGIKSLTNPSAGKMTVTYDKSNGSSGYVVRYGLKSDMSDAKVITVQGQNTLSRTFGGMKKGKTYFVQVRTYKLDNGVRYYSGYCTTKMIKITK